MHISTQIDNNLQSVTFVGNLQTKTPPKSEIENRCRFLGKPWLKHNDFYPIKRNLAQAPGESLETLHEDTNGSILQEIIKILVYLRRSKLTITWISVTSDSTIFRHATMARAAAYKRKVIFLSNF